MNQQQINYQQQQNQNNYIDGQSRQQQPQPQQLRQLTTAEQQQQQAHRPYQQNNYSPTNNQEQQQIQNPNQQQQQQLPPFNQSQSYNSLNSINNNNNSRTPRSSNNHSNNSNNNQRAPTQQIQQQQPELQSPTTSASHYTPTASNSPVVSQQDHSLNPIPSNSNLIINNNINRGEFNSTPPLGGLGSNTKIPQPITRTSFSSGRRESTGNASPVLTTTSRRGSGVPPATIAGEPIHDMDRAIALLKGQKFYAEGFVMKRVEVAADGKTVSIYY